MDHERRFRDVCCTSVLPPRATVEHTLLDVSEAPLAAIRARELDRLHSLVLNDANCCWPFQEFEQIT